MSSAASASIPIPNGGPAVPDAGRPRGHRGRHGGLADRLDRGRRRPGCGRRSRRAVPGAGRPQDGLGHRHGLGDADAEDVGQNVWLKLAGELEKIRIPAALAGWLTTTTRRECGRILRVPPGSRDTGQAPDTQTIPDDDARTAEGELLAAERHAALREAFADLPPCCQQLIALLTESPPPPYAQISARLGLPADSIGPNRGRCLDKLRRHPAIAALTNPDAGTTS